MAAHAKTSTTRTTSKRPPSASEGRYAAVLLEQVRSEFKGVVDGMHAMGERLERRMDEIEVRMSVRFQNLDGAVRTLAAGVHSLDVRVTALEAKVTALDGKVTALDGKVTALDDKVTALDVRITALEGGLRSLTTEVRAFRADFDGREERAKVIVLEHRVTALEQRVGAA